MYCTNCGNEVESGQAFCEKYIYMDFYIGLLHFSSILFLIGGLYLVSI